MRRNGDPSLSELLYRTSLAELSFDDVRARVRAAVRATRYAGDGVTADIVAQRVATRPSARVIEIPEQRAQSLT